MEKRLTQHRYQDLINQAAEDEEGEDPEFAEYIEEGDVRRPVKVIKNLSEDTIMRPLHTLMAEPNSNRILGSEAYWIREYVNRSKMENNEIHGWKCLNVQKVPKEKQLEEETDMGSDEEVVEAIAEPVPENILQKLGLSPMASPRHTSNGHSLKRNSKRNLS